MRRRIAATGAAIYEVTEAVFAKLMDNGRPFEADGATTLAWCRHHGITILAATPQAD